MCLLPISAVLADRRNDPRGRFFVEPSPIFVEPSSLLLDGPGEDLLV